ncbi:putative endolysin [Acinetobacter phage Ab_SZ3]|uniref:Putative endolysin n=1 Tax=Acinetobacter phage Ab_SZ3 TaxID=2781361 RepID=A0A873WKL4_9CAUD|nr:putative endolysin [Acinetobacter phage Ab_SZ3]
MVLTKNGFAIIKERFGRLTQSQVDELNYIVGEIDRHKNVSYPQAAYMLATTWLECDGTMLPIREYGLGKKKKYGQWFTNKNGEKYGYVNDKGKTYLQTEYNALYYGRGYVQLTWLENYVKAGLKLGHDFAKNPDDVMIKEWAVKILITGMMEGWFTGHALTRYISQSKKDYVGARRVINSQDRANKVAEYAQVFEKALRSN